MSNKKIGNIIFILAILVFVANILYVWNSQAMRSTIMGNDEYFFYRTTMNLPNLETTGVWLVEAGSPFPIPEDKWANYVFDAAYTTPIWIHPLIANVIAYPVAMMFDDVVSQIQWLRLFDVAIIIITVVLLLDVIRRKTNGVIAGISILPMLVGRFLLANGIMFYHDLFMWLFFALTMWVITKNPHSKWIILLSILTVLSKINAPLLLLPIIVYLGYQTRDKMVLARVGIISVVAVLGYMTFQAVVAGDAFYVFHHWDPLSYARTNFGKNVLPYFWDYVASWGLWMSMPLLFAGVFLTFKRRIKVFYGFACFGLVTLAYSYGWGFFGYHVFPTMYASMFMIPIVLGIRVNEYDKRGNCYID
jgi:hypothetical protein